MDLGNFLAVFLMAWSGSAKPDQRFAFLYAGAVFRGETFLDGWVSSVAAGDVDGDGHMDLVTMHGYGYPLCRISVLRGRGDGSLFEHSFQRFEITEAPGPYGPRVALSDLDSDGHLDLVATASVTATDSVVVFLGDGRGSFGPPVEHPTGGQSAQVRIADMDGDGRQDLVLALRDKLGISVLLGDGSGGFVLRQALSAGYDFFGPSDIEVAEVTEDGIPDVIAALPSGLLVFLRNAGDGSLQRPVRIPLGAPVTAIALNDFDLDGILDLACGVQGGVAFLAGLGGGAFEQRGGVHLFKGQPVTDLDAVQLGRPGQPGLWAHCGPNYGTLALIHVDSTLAAGEVQFEPLNAWNCRLAAADLDEDGLPEFVASASRDGSWLPEIAIVFPSGVNGWIRGAVSSPIPPMPPNWSDSRRLVLLEDLDGDGAADAVLDGFKDLCILRGHTTGQFSDPSICALSNFGTTAPVAGDFDGDGKRDLAMGRCVGYALSPLGPWPYYFGSGVTFLFGNGDGSFGDAKWVSLARRARPPLELERVDLDGDGVDELAAYASAEGTLQVLRLDSSGELAVVAESSVPTRGRLLPPMDVDGDGHQEILLVLGGTSTARAMWSVAWNPPSGLTPPKEIHSLPQDEELALEVSDWNHDGNLDVAVGTGTLSSYVVYTDGTYSSWNGLDGVEFEPTGYVRTRGATYPYPPCDLDGDGLAEHCARVDFSVGAVLAVWGRDAGSGLTSLGQYSTAQLATQFPDMNGDGLADIVYTAYDRIYTSFNLATGDR
jgi:hypothetical protein